MATGNGIISAPVSRFQRTTHSANFIKNQLNQQMKASLIAEAKAQAPDTDAITEQLGEMNFHAGDKQQKQAQINAQLSAFSQGFRENPFYAFSKDGRNQLGQVSNILNDPMNEQLAQRKTRDDETYKLASTDGILGQLQINGNQIKVVDRNSKRSDWINIDQFNADRDSYVPLTVAEDYNYTAQRGAANSRDFSVSMSSYNDVLTRANTIFDKVGSTTNTTISPNGEALLKLTRSSNASQIAQASAYLKENGLTQNDINTLVSMEFSTNPNQTYEEAKINALASLQNLANTKIETDTDRDVGKNPNASGSGSGSGDDGLTGVATLNVAQRVLYGGEQDHFWNYSAGTGDMTDETVTKYATRGTSIDNLLFGKLDVGSKTFKNDDGETVYNREVMKNGAFRGVVTNAIANNSMRYIDENGDLQVAPGSLMRNAVILSNGEDVPMIVNHLVGNNGQLATTEQMKIYTKFKEDKLTNPNAPPPLELKAFEIPAKNNAGEIGASYNLQPALAFTAIVPADDSAEFGEGTEKRLREDGVQIVGNWAMRGNVNDELTDNMYKYVKDNTQQDPYEDINDNILMPKMIIPIPDYEVFAGQLGAPKYTSKQSLATQSGNKYGGDTIFISDGSRRDTNTISNQVKGKNLSVF